MLHALQSTVNEWRFKRAIKPFKDAIVAAGANTQANSRATKALKAAVIADLAGAK